MSSRIVFEKMALPFESESNFGKHGEYGVSQNDLIRQVSMKRDSSDNNLPRVRNPGYRADTFGGRCRQRADQFRDFLSTALCTAFSRVPSVVLVILAFILIVVMISAVPLAFYFSYSNSDASSMVANKPTDEDIGRMVPPISTDYENSAIILIPEVEEEPQFSNRSCLANEFKNETVQCSSKRSYPKKYACSGFIGDCKGHCDKCDEELAFTCGNRTCISKKLVCNGQDDCGNGADEQGCDCVGKQACRAKSPSGRTKCFGEEQRCDGMADCPDREDEENCTSCTNNPLGFYCKASKKCILSIQRCDGNDDCLDEEDESDCSCEECKYVMPMYGCSSAKRCFRMNQVCRQAVSVCPDPTEEDNSFCQARSHTMPVKKKSSNIVF